MQNFASFAACELKAINIISNGNHFVLRSKNADVIKNCLTFQNDD
jgi:hypothetical protein